MTPEQAQKAGFHFANAHLKVIEAAYGKEIAAQYSHGYAWAARDFLYKNVSPRGAYDRIQELADGCVTARTT